MLAAVRQKLSCHRLGLFNYLVGRGEQHRRHFQSERPLTSWKEEGCDFRKGRSILVPSLPVATVASQDQSRRPPRTAVFAWDEGRISVAAESRAIPRVISADRPAWVTASSLKLARSAR